MTNDDTEISEQIPVSEATISSEPLVETPSVSLEDVKKAVGEVNSIMQKTNASFEEIKTILPAGAALDASAQQALKEKETLSKEVQTLIADVKEAMEREKQKKDTLVSLMELVMDMSKFLKEAKEGSLEQSKKEQLEKYIDLGKKGVDILQGSVTEEEYEKILKGSETMKKNFETMRKK